ncbi:MAG: GUN4 domain-containing protein [Synechococcaceae cyanobacterium RL_1_2]|nr:GUN4 domain-containing protein [Synechococcaceae cyanobacterium RL_1_2]
MKSRQELISQPLRPEDIPNSLQRLNKFLKRGSWQDADRETDLLLLKFSQRTTVAAGVNDEPGKLYLPDLELIVMDKLWIRNSRRKFGFSVQKEIWQQCGGEPGSFDKSVLESFGEKVGWRKNGRWLDYKKIGYDISGFVGHLPTAIEHREYCEVILSIV